LSGLFVLFSGLAMRRIYARVDSRTSWIWLVISSSVIGLSGGYAALVGFVTCLVILLVLLLKQGRLIQSACALLICTIGFLGTPKLISEVRGQFAYEGLNVPTVDIGDTTTLETRLLL